MYLFRFVIFNGVVHLQSGLIKANYHSGSNETLMCKTTHYVSHRATLVVAGSPVGVLCHLPNLQVVLVCFNFHSESWLLLMLPFLKKKNVFTVNVDQDNTN